MARFLEVTTFELGLLRDLMGKRVSRVFRERAPSDIEGLAEHDKRNLLFSRALQLNQPQLQSLSHEWNLARTGLGGESLVSSEVVG